VQKFGDHREAAVICMRWARGVTREAFADPLRDPSPDADARSFLAVRPLPTAGLVATSEVMT
jgi:hypothetical protein